MSVTRVLIIDDHPAMRYGLAQLIGREPDFEVCGEAGDRTAGLTAVERCAPDLVLLDIALGENVSGLDLIRDIRSRAGDVHILVVSMHDETLYAERALRAGARGYLMKQEPVRTVIEAVRRILGGGVYVSDAMSRKLLLRHVGSDGRSDERDPADRLSNREFEVFRLIGKGSRPREIADTLCLSVKTIETHRFHIRRKLGLSDAGDLTRFAVAWTQRAI
jgi:DNA-binding NarL/FixJ family response regulator